MEASGELTALETVMSDLHSEVHGAETIVQRAIDATWQKVILILQQRTKEQEMTGSSLRDKITALSNQVDTQNKIISELQKDKERLADDLEETRKKESSKCEELLSLKQNIKQRDEQLASMRSSLATTEKEHAYEVALLQTRLKEQSSMLKEYQDKVTVATTKMQKLSHQLTAEKNANEKIRTTYSSQVTKQSSEVKKMSLELSKLKAEVSSSNKALAAAKSEAKKLQEQLKIAKETSANQSAVLHQEHLRTIKGLREKIAFLEHEIEQLKLKHSSEIEQINRQYSQQDNSFMDARIAFLHHQNRQEKVKINQGTRR